MKFNNERKSSCRVIQLIDKFINLELESWVIIYNIECYKNNPYKKPFYFIMVRIIIYVVIHLIDKFKYRSLKAGLYKGRAKSLRTFLIIFIIDVRSFSYFHKCNNGLLSIFMQNIFCQI